MNILMMKNLAERLYDISNLMIKIQICRQTVLLMSPLVELLALLFAPEVLMQSNEIWNSGIEGH